MFISKIDIYMTIKADNKYILKLSAANKAWKGIMQWLQTLMKVL